MPWWQKILQHFLSGKLASDNKILDNVEQIKIGADNTSQKQVIINHGTIVINNTPQENAADQAIKKVQIGVLDKGDTVVEAGSAEKFNAIEATLFDKGVQGELSKFEGVVPSKDMPILESAIVIQSQYNQGLKVNEFMRDISIKYGKRGSMICHLYSAGYFDSIILPAYNEIVNNDNPDIKSFYTLYEMIVTVSPLAIFVAWRDTADSIAKQIITKININKEINVNYLNIHGIGPKNVDCIRKALEKKAVRELLVGEPVKETLKNMTTITIYF